MSCNITYTVKNLLYFSNKFVGLRIDLEDDLNGQSLFDLSMTMIDKYKIPYTENCNIPKLELKNYNGVFKASADDNISELTESTKGFYPKLLWYCEEFGHSEYFTCADIEDCSECPLEGNSEGYCGYMDREGVCASFGTTYAETPVGNLEGDLEMSRIKSEKYYERLEEKARLAKEKKEEQSKKRRATVLANKDITDEINKCKKAISALKSKRNMILSYAFADSMFNGGSIPDKTKATEAVDKEIAVLERNIELLQEKKKERNKERRLKEKEGNK